MSRPSVKDIAMQTAYLWAKRSTCPKKSVGAVVLTASGRVAGVGYNGARAGQPHCETIGCDLDDQGDCVRAVHAEANALEIAGIQAKGGVLYCTDFPCPKCAALAIRANVAEIWYHRDRSADHKREASMWQFRKAGITVRQYEGRIQ